MEWKEAGIMKQKVSDYIADYIAEWGIRDVFTVTGGGAMHMNDAFGHHPKLHCTYQHHEQACAMAAEAYARMDNRMAAVCVTTGPGATNAITGVLGGWMDSIPMLVFSGQARYATTVAASGLKLRSMGVQECNIVPVVTSITKYAQMIIHPEDIRYHLEKALYMAVNGRPGPVWLDIPLDVQGAYVDTEQLVGFDAADYEAGGTGWALHTVGLDHTSGAAVFAGATEEKEKKAVLAGVHGTEGTSVVEPPHAIAEDYAGKGEHRQVLPAPVSRELAKEIIEKIRNAKRPVLYAGNGIRIAGAFDAFMEVADGLGIPAVVGWNANDCLYDDCPWYVGRPGNLGDRPGNLAVQNSDLVFSVGSRLSIRQVGYNYKTWAREAYVIMNDVDPEELKKPSVHVDMPVHADAKDLMETMAAVLREEYDKKPDRKSVV